MRRDLVREKKLAVWNEIVEKVNVDFDRSRKEFWAFVGRTKCKKQIIASLKNEAGVSVTSTKGKLEAFQKHYEHLGRVSMDSDFYSNWKELVERKVSMCGSLSKVCEDEALDREIEKAEIVKCICKRKNNKTGGSDGLVLSMVAREWFTCWSIYLELSGMRRLYLRNGERGSLLIYLRKVIRKNQVITGVLRY